MDLTAQALSTCATALVLDALTERTPSGPYRVSLALYLALAASGQPLLAGLAGTLGTLLVPGLRHEWQAILQGLVVFWVSLGLLYWKSDAMMVGLVLASLWGWWRVQALPKDLQGRRLARACLPFWLIWPWGCLLAQSGEFAAVLVGAFLWVLSKGLINAVFRIYAVQATEALHDREVSQMAVEHLREQLNEQEATLASEARQRRLVERLVEQLAQGPDLAATQRAVLETLSRILVTRSVAMFLWNPSESRLEASCWLSPDGDQLLDSGSAIEPLIDLAWKGSRLVSRQDDPNLLSSLFPREDQAMAVALAQVGVLYVGRESHPWTKEDRQTLNWVAEKALLGLQGAWRHHYQVELQRQQSSVNIQLREHVQLLERLVQGANGISSQLTMEGLLRALEAEVRALFHHDLAAVYLLARDSLQLVHSWSTQERPLDLQTLKRAAQSSLAEHRALVYPNIPDSEIRSVLCVPLLEQPEGALVLGSTQVEAFQREELQLFLLLSLQTAVTMRNASLYEEIRQAKQRLEQSQAQLIQSSKLTAIGQLAAGVAHELNTPLGAVSLSLDLLSLQFPDGNRHIDNAHGAVERARTIVDKLLVYSRRTQGAEVERVGLADVVRGATDLVQSRIRQQKVSLENPCELNPQVMAKSVELQQVVVNLILNAVDAYPDKSESRRLLLRVGNDASSAWIAVQDWAGGIPEEIQDQVFDPFFTTKAIGKGTGLGLSISREICSAYQGELSFESHGAEGTTFTMKFPKAPPES